MMDILIFDVGMGQCIFFYPHPDPNYGLMVDCGSNNGFDPVDKLIEWKLMPFNATTEKHKLKNLTLTNYDQDHFSGLPYLRTRVWIETVNFPKNLTAVEIERLKPDVTEPIEDVIEILNTYTYDVTNYNPPYVKHCYYLSKSNFPNEGTDTNKLSQLVFVTFKGIRMCIPGDLTSPAWDKHLFNTNVTTLLASTDIFVASHHGREDGYNGNVFTYCKPESIILSDKYIVHGTQEGMASKYSAHVRGNGVVLNGDARNLRKTLTTRSDGHIWIRINADGWRTYKTV